MASISRDSNGRRRILFIGADGKRRTIRLGKVSRRDAEAVKVKVEQLAAAAISGHAPDDETLRWVTTREATMIKKLQRVKLMGPTADSQSALESPTLQAFLDRYLSVRTDVKLPTLTVWGHTRRNLIQFFNFDQPLQDINRGHAQEWRLSLIEQGLSESTVRKRCGFAKQFFAFAVKHELIPSNPFAELKSAAKANRKRDYFVSRKESEMVLEACPDAQWRLLFALSRYGGLRCPSEHLLVRWGDIDWERGTIHVRSPKTEHHDGGESRVIPLFSELRPFLEECFELAEPGEEFVISRYRSTNANLRTHLLRIIKRAGLTPWPKLFQNLRSTRQTELEEIYPSHVVCAWIGNSEKVAREHYLQVTEEHYSKAAQNPAQQSAEMPRKAPQATSRAHEETPVFPGVAKQCENLRSAKVEDRGLEPLTS